jgi:hypothetical protein
MTMPTFPHRPRDIERRSPMTRREWLVVLLVLFVAVISLAAVLDFTGHLPSVVSPPV